MLQITSSGSSLIYDIYSRKSFGPRVDARGTPAIGYSGKDFPSRTTQRGLLLRREEIRQNTSPSPEIP